MTNCIKTRFSQPGYRAVKNIEQLILNDIIGLHYQNQLEDVLSDDSEKIVSGVINYMKNNIGVQTDFYSEIIVLLKLYLASPATNAASERSASSIHHIKN